MCEEINTDNNLKGSIEDIINLHCRENKSHTPDFILAEYLLQCLKAFEAASNAREKWYGKGLRINEKDEVGVGYNDN